MSSSRPVGRIWRGVDALRVTAATFAVELPGGARAQATSMVDRIDAARAEGYEQGWAAARDELARSADGERRRQTAELVEALTAAAAAVVGDRQRAVSVAQHEVVALAVELAEAVVRRDLAMGSHTAADALHRALSLAPAGEDLLVRLHSSDVVDAGELQALVPDRQVRVLADDTVEPGGCLVEAGPCHIDAQIGPAMARARRLLAGLRPHAVADETRESAESGEVSEVGEPSKAGGSGKTVVPGTPMPTDSVESVLDGPLSAVVVPGDPVVAESGVAESGAAESGMTESGAVPIEAVESAPGAAEPVPVESAPVAAEPVVAPDGSVLAAAGAEGRR